MTAATTTAPVKVSPRTVRVRRDQEWWWSTDPIWRSGPKAPDGFWMVDRISGTAVRLVFDDGAPTRSASAFRQVLEDARQAETIDAQDAYLARLTLAAELPLDELERIRDAARSGRAGGAHDGSPRKARKAAAS